MRYTYVREIKMQMHDSSCATQHLCMMGNLICAAHRYVRSTSIKGRGEKGSKAASLQLVQGTLRQAASLFLRACSGCPRHLGARPRRSCQAHPSHPQKPLYLTSTKRPIWRAFKKIYFVLLRLPKSLLVVIVVVVGNDNISPCRSEVGSRGRGSGDISSLASCCLTLTPSPAFCTSAPQSYDNNTWIL